MGVMEKEVIGKLFLIATSPAESAWGIAVHTAQRLAIEADQLSWDCRRRRRGRGIEGGAGDRDPDLSELWDHGADADRS
jgi:hypothetical protein